MATILIVDTTPARAEALSHAFLEAGHVVELEPDSFRARERLSGPSFDLLVVDASTPDGGAGLLIAQARLAWTRTPVLALTDGARLKRSKLAEMGLWTPDEVVEAPCSLGAITFSAFRLLHNAQRRETATRAANDRARPPRASTPPGTH